VQGLEEEYGLENTGLRGVSTATTSICNIEGEKGQLFYRGYNIEDLASKSSYEEVAYLLIHRKMPKRGQLDSFSTTLAERRKLPGMLISMLEGYPKSAWTMDVLQSAVALLGDLILYKERGTRELDLQQGTSIIAKMPSLVAAWYRMKNGLDVIDPDPNLSHAASFLHVLTGKVPEPRMAKLFDAAMIMHAEHSFNASTFTSRVIASTGADIFAAVSGAIGSLSGTLHGGANEEVMRNLIEIGEIEMVESWVAKRLDQAQRIAGIGHAVYKMMDPRAHILQSMLDEMEDKGGKWLEMSRKLAEVAHEEIKKRKGLSLYPNVDLYSGALYFSLGIPTSLFTPVFAVARTAGWVAHILEEKYPRPPVKPVLYRPRATYVGRYCGDMGCKYIPPDERG
jgi:citrate synthase